MRATRYENYDMVEMMTSVGVSSSDSQQELPVDIDSII